MNIANKLTLSRIVATFIFMALLLSDIIPYSKTAATVVFILACITDWVDGHIARRLNVESDFGKLMDPLADKILICAAFIAFVELPQIALQSWIVIIIIGREFTITGLRLLAATKGEIIPAGFWGKNKTISQIVTIISILIYLTLMELANVHGFKIPDSFFITLKTLTAFIMAITVLLTIISGFVYVYNNRHLIKET